MMATCPRLSGLSACPSLASFQIFSSRASSSDLPSPSANSFHGPVPGRLGSLPPNQSRSRLPRSPLHPASSQSIPSATTSDSSLLLLSGNPQPGPIVRHPKLSPPLWDLAAPRGGCGLSWFTAVPTITGLLQCGCLSLQLIDGGGAPHCPLSRPVNARWVAESSRRQKISLWGSPWP